MEWIIVFTVIGIAILVLHRVFVTKLNISNRKESLGTITNIISFGSLLTIYTIEFKTENEKILVGKTSQFADSNKKYKVGDIVPINYCYNKSGKLEIDLTSKYNIRYYTIDKLLILGYLSLIHAMVLLLIYLLTK